MAPVILDFTNVKESSGINPVRQPPGDYVGKVIKADLGESNKGNKQIKFVIQDVDRQSATYPYYCQLTEDLLWKLRNLIVATGKTVPKKRLKFDPDTLIGKTLGMGLDDDEYEGKVKSIIVAVFPESDMAENVKGEEDDEDEEEEAPPARRKAAAKPAKKKAAAKPAVADDDDEDEDEDLDEVDIDDL
jgi:hypothetical protein